MTNSSIVKFAMMLAVLVCAVGRPSGSQSQPQASRSQAPPGITQHQEVRCPIQEARTEITTPLPKPWWNTPQLGKLKGVAVQVIGGQNTLVCRYWAYGTQVSVMRLFPEGAHSCSPVSDHFVCR